MGKSRSDLSLIKLLMISAVPRFENEISAGKFEVRDMDLVRPDSDIAR